MEYFLGYKLCLGSEETLEQSYDAYTILLKLSPFLGKFLLKALDESIDPLRSAAIRGLEFMIEYLGCTLNSQIPQILKQVVLTYPLGSGKQTQSK